MFGEAALVTGNSRSASCVCTEDSTLMVIQKPDFDRILKHEFKASLDAKMKILRRHIPGIKDLSEEKAVLIGHYFVKKSFPRGHVFFQQGCTSKLGTFLVSKGNVELKWQAEGEEDRPRTLGLIVEGGIFGSSSTGSPEPFTLVVGRSACEVLHVSPGGFRRLPNIIKRLLVEHLAETTTWRQSINPPPLLHELIGNPPRSPSSPSHTKGLKGSCLWQPGKIDSPNAKSRRNRHVIDIELRKKNRLEPEEERAIWASMSPLATHGRPPSALTRLTRPNSAPLL